ncbi:13557_t:CDS:2 [Racocetra fulgida]|uniref:13557_t:CDS:1 n=1 Tax=Racocetra fulgida TaxID=60492 RepID=A0A9N9AF14_9GLOM|nr:13557_t:CDS:2 [Racocetra fulgida]
MEFSGIIANRKLDEWKINREFFIKMAMSKKFLKMLTEKTHEKATDTFKLWDIMINDKRDVDLSKWLEKFAGDIAFEDFLGELIKRRRAEINSLSNSTLLPSDFLTLLLTANTSRDLEHTSFKSLNRPLNDYEILVLSEINEIFGQKISLNSLYEDTEKLLYCDALIKEALRLIAPFPYLQRSNSEPVEVGGYLWKEEQTFFLQYQKININKNDWIDAEIFDPERFLKNENNKRSMNAKEANNKRAFATFGGGARICPVCNLYNL